MSFVRRMGTWAGEATTIQLAKGRGTDCAPDTSPPSTSFPLVPRLDGGGPRGQEELALAGRSLRPDPPPVPRAQAQKENYRQEKRRATRQLLSALTDPGVVIMADSLKVGAGLHQGPP